MEIAAATVNACQHNMKKDMRRKFNSSLQSFIMDGCGFVFFNAHT